MLPPTVDASRDYSELQKPLEHFRAKTKRLKIHPAERIVLWVVSAHMIFLPWAFGARNVWAQIISLSVAAVGFALSLLPRNYSEEHTGSNHFRLIMWPKLFKFPIFWLGLALLGLVVVQALNPAWSLRTDGGTMVWTLRIAHIEWLPPGIEAPFERWNQWRMLVIYSSAWLTVCSIWVAFTRRRTLQLFLIALSINGLLLAVLGVVQRFVGNGKFYWFVPSPTPTFFASFVYKNHAGAYLDLMLAITCGLAGWYYLRGLRRLEKSNPSGVFAFFATCIAVSVLTSYARGATVIMLLFLLLCIGAFVVHQLILPSENRKPIVAIVLLAIFASFLKTGLQAVRSEVAWDRLKAGVLREDKSLEFREQLTAAASQMLGEHWLLGVGAGGFRYTFPNYQFRDPDLIGNVERPTYWEHAHNDVLQYPIELGLTGSLIIAAGFGFWFLTLLRAYFWENPLSACVVLGLMLMILYAWWDFPLQSPAILITWCALWCAATMWAKFEESGAKG